MSLPQYESLGLYPWTKNNILGPSNLDSNPTEPHEHNGLFIDVTEQKTSKSTEPKVFPTPQPFQATKADQNASYSEYSLVLRRKFDIDKTSEQFLDEELEINDHVIKEAIRAAMAEHPFLDMRGAAIKFKLPFHDLFHYYAELRAYNAECNDEQKCRLKLLFRFIDDRLGKVIQESKDLTSRHIISSKLLWTIYKPDSVVVSKRDDTIRCYRVQYPQNVLKCIFMLSWGFDGASFGKVSTKVNMPDFAGVCKIEDLPDIPFDFLPEDQQVAVKEQLILRGQKWKNHIHFSHKSFKGTAIEFKIKQSSDSRGPRRVDGRIITDTDTYMRYNGGNQTTLNKSNISSAFSKRLNAESELNDADIYSIIADSPDYQISKKQALLCPPTVPGYALQEKIWAEFPLDNIEDIHWDSQCFDKLQLDDGLKSVMKSLISNHEHARTSFKHVVARKGLGRIFLLHGPPGSGKTLTAETVSEHFKKPLYCATSGELGTRVEAAEAALAKIFDLSQTWKAVLLIDEADVFLAKRQTTDIGRNAFVSIFLRSLEYYQGIMILTTNKIQDFDKAFSSRIHLTLGYKVPNATKRAAIWKNLFLNHQIEGVGELNDKDFERLGIDYDLNGRELQNLFSTARTYALGRENMSGVTPDSIALIYSLSGGDSTLDKKGDSH